MINETQDNSSSFYNKETGVQALKTLTTLGILGVLVKEKPYVVTLGALIGLTFPETSIKKTDFMWNTIFNPEKLEQFRNKEELEWDESVYNFMITKAFPRTAMFGLGLLTLPTITYPALTFIFGVKMGADGFQLHRVLTQNENKKKQAT